MTDQKVDLPTVKPISLSGFFKHLTDFSDDTRAEYMNATQVTLLSIVPIYLVLVLHEYVFPDPDPSKGSLELTMEVLLQILALVMSVYIVNRGVIYVPPYSGVPYVPSANFVGFIGSFLLLVFIMHDHVSAKLHILYSRFASKYLDDEVKKPQKKKTDDKPIHQTPGLDSIPKAGLLPTDNGGTGFPSGIENFAPKNNDSSDVNQMQDNSQQNPAAPFEPMAANEGSGGFSSW